MYLKVNNKKIRINKLTNFFDRIKSLRFILEKIDYGLLFPKKHGITTVFLCQKIDIIMTDKENKILYIYKNVKSEKYFFPRRKVYNIFFLPLKTADNFNKGDIIELNEENDESK